MVRKKYNREVTPMCGSAYYKYYGLKHVVLLLFLVKKQDEHSSCSYFMEVISLCYTSFVPIIE